MQSSFQSYFKIIIIIIISKFFGDKCAIEFNLIFFFKAIEKLHSIVTMPESLY